MNALLSTWLTTGEPRAAGRLGLFRIIFVLFYLWHLVDYFPPNLSGIPAVDGSWMLLSVFLPQDLPPAFFQGLYTIIIAALVLLLIGYQTRSATLVVGLLGALFESFYVELDFEHSTPFLTAYIPAVMFLCGDWGATYSIDAALRRRRGGESISVEDDSLRFVLPIKVILVLLAALFCSAGLSKAAPVSNWFSQDSVFGNLMLSRYVKAALYDRPLNPMPMLFVDVPALDTFMRWFVMLFELTFPMALIHRKIRACYLNTALTFHSVNAIWLGVTFTPVLIVYLLFVDWQALWSRLAPAPRRGSMASATLAAIAGALTVIFTALWTQTDVLQSVITLGGTLDTYTIWYPIFPIATVGFGLSVIRLLGLGANRYEKSGGAE